MAQCSNNFKLWHHKFSYSVLIESTLNRNKLISREIIPFFFLLIHQVIYVISIYRFAYSIFDLFMSVCRFILGQNSVAQCLPVKCFMKIAFNDRSDDIFFFAKHSNWNAIVIDVIQGKYHKRREYDYSIEVTKYNERICLQIYSSTNRREKNRYRYDTVHSAISSHALF